VLPLLRLLLTTTPRIRHEVRVAAPPAAVWDVVSRPASWSALEPFCGGVERAPGQVAPGQRLVAVGRPLGLRVPVDVEDVDPEERLGVTVRLLPGLGHRLEHRLLPSATGGTRLIVEAQPEGVFARALALPLWAATAVGARMVARAAAVAYRETGRPGAGGNPSLP
jgi:uncharacterized protein YndB with AHSA1/START domain